MLRVCIDARLIDGISGGIQQAVIGLASGLSKLTDGPEEYRFLAYDSADEWIRPYLDGPCRILHTSADPSIPSWKTWVKSKLPLAREAWHQLSPLAGRLTVKVPESDGTVERAGADIMHFTLQSAFLTDVPSIYHPWDLQHLHLPHFFLPLDRLGREVRYRAYIRQARMVAVASQWGRRDLIEHYQVEDEKIQVVPVAPALAAYPIPTEHDLDAAKRKFLLPERFAFYPAQTWAHKNHLGLLEALAILRDRCGHVVPVVFSGRLNEFYPRIKRRVRELGLEHQTLFLGFVSPLEVQSLYRLSRCMIFPTLFEGGGMPLTEAFLAGTPAACSNITCLPEQAADAALLFDPGDPHQIAEAIRRLWIDDALRKELVLRGRERVARCSWERTARIFRAHYRRIAGRQLCGEDRDILEEAATV